MSLNKTIILREKVWVPIHKIDTDQAEQDFTKIFYDERACRVCDNKHEKHNHICDECPAFLGRYRTYAYKEKNGTQFIGIPMGQRHRLVSDYGLNLKKFNIVDKRVCPPFDYNIKFTGQLRDYQGAANDTWFKTKYGLVIAPPRSGKTIMMLALAIKLGLRMVLLASQYEFLKQFIEHIEKFSNLPALERKHGKKLYGYPKTEKDFNTMQIMCCTYQQFISDKNGKTRLKWLSNNVGTVFIDEVQDSNSPLFSRIASHIPAKYKAGFTATEKRKDGKHVLVWDIIGPNRYVVRRKELVPKLTVHITDVKAKARYTGPAGFTYALTFLSKHEKRNQLIIDHIIKDLKKGRSIVVPLARKQQIFELTQRINNAWGSKIADYFIGANGKKGIEKRDKLIAQARSGKIRVVVGIIKLLSKGLNVPRWDTLFYSVPMSNQPNWKQMSSRILTPDDDGTGKQEPLIRMFVDPDIGISAGCFANTWIQSLQFGYKPTEVARQRAMPMLSKSRQRQAESYHKPKPDKGIWSKLKK